MAQHFRQGRRPKGPLLGAGLAVVVVAAGVGVFAALHHGSPASASAPAGAGHPAAPAVTVPPAPLTISPSQPAAGASGVDGTQPLVLATSAAVVTTGRTPVISPAVAGTWSDQPGRLVFTPTDAFDPATTYTVTVPAGAAATDGAVLARPIAYTWTTETGSALRLQQLLAELGYLPLSWTAQAGAAPVPPVQAAYHPPAGQFAWTWSSPPATLAAQWVEGQSTAMTRGAVMAFESDHSLSTDGVAGGQVWAALLAATTSATPAQNPHGYTYARADKGSPETLTVWHDGQVVSDTTANTGIPQAPTADGTYPVYERLATQTMTGTNPDGSRYSDPVAWVAYFNGGDAVHYIARSSYGYPQSLGCVEVSYATGAKVWPYLTIGSLVTVAG